MHTEPHTIQQLPQNQTNNTLKNHLPANHHHIWGEQHTGRSLSAAAEDLSITRIAGLTWDQWNARLAMPLITQLREGQHPIMFPTDLSIVSLAAAARSAQAAVHAAAAAASISSAPKATPTATANAAATKHAIVATTTPTPSIPAPVTACATTVPVPIAASAVRQTMRHIPNTIAAVVAHRLPPPAASLPETNVSYVSPPAKISTYGATTPNYGSNRPSQANTPDYNPYYVPLSPTTTSSLTQTTTTTVTDTTTHQTIATPATDNNGGSGGGVGYACPECGRVYKLKSSLRNHLKWECGKDPQFQCPFCVYRAKQKMHIGRHMERMHKEKFVKLESEQLLEYQQIVQHQQHLQQQHQHHEEDNSVVLNLKSESGSTGAGAI